MLIFLPATFLHRYPRIFSTYSANFSDSRTTTALLFTPSYWMDMPLSATIPLHFYNVGPPILPCSSPTLLSLLYLFFASFIFYYLLSTVVFLPPFYCGRAASHLVTETLPTPSFSFLPRYLDTAPSFATAFLLPPVFGVAPLLLLLPTYLFCTYMRLCLQFALPLPFTVLRCHGGDISLCLCCCSLSVLLPCRARVLLYRLFRTGGGLATAPIAVVFCPYLFILPTRQFPTLTTRCRCLFSPAFLLRHTGRFTCLLLHTCYT